MDTQTEQRIRERAYELWMQHGSLPDRAEEYWFQAEREILEEGTPSLGPLSLVGREEDVPVEVSAAPLGMTSETVDEVLQAPAQKVRKRRNSASVAAEPGVVVAAPSKRKRTVPPA